MSPGDTAGAGGAPGRPPGWSAGAGSGDLAVEVAAQVRAESGWEPRWQRLVLACLLGVAPVLVALPRLPVEAVAMVAVGAALASRAVPRQSARLAQARLERRPGPRHRPPTVRVTREHALAAYGVCGLSLVATQPLLLADGPRFVAVATLSGLSVLLQHRAEWHPARLAVAAEVVEAAVLIALLPLLALATQGWWA